MAKRIRTPHCVHFETQRDNGAPGGLEVKGMERARENGECGILRLALFFVRRRIMEGIDLWNKDKNTIH
jgi:hypothetical protein